MRLALLGVAASVLAIQPACVIHVPPEECSQTVTLRVERGTCELFPNPCRGDGAWVDGDGFELGDGRPAAVSVRTDRVMGETTRSICVAPGAPSMSSEAVPFLYTDPSTGISSTGSLLVTVPGALGGADVAVSVIADPDPAPLNTILTYTITVTNNGPLAAPGVTLTDVLPRVFELDSVTTTKGSCTLTSSPDDFTIVCALGSLAVGATATVTVNAFPFVTGPVTNTATVISEATDPDPANNTATKTTTVFVPVADLSIAMIDSPDPAVVGQPLTYTIAVTNKGPDAARSVRVFDTLPPVVSFASAGSGCVRLGLSPTVSCAPPGGALAANATVTFDIVVTPTSSGVVSNTASVSTSSSDPELGNNFATQTTVVE
jgi:uncharacterized repeat protein (TIGR01451 family)